VVSTTSSFDAWVARKDSDSGSSRPSYGIAVALGLALRLDLADQLRDLVAILELCEVAERRQMGEAYEVAGGEIVGTKFLAAVARRPFFGPVEPEALQLLAVDQGPSALNPGLSTGDSTKPSLTL